MNLLLVDNIEKRRLICSIKFSWNSATILSALFTKSAFVMIIACFFLRTVKERDCFKLTVSAEQSFNEN